VTVPAVDVSCAINAQGKISSPRRTASRRYLFFIHAPFMQVYARGMPNMIKIVEHFIKIL
jgi:hypothetical protein